MPRIDTGLAPGRKKAYLLYKAAMKEAEEQAKVLEQEGAKVDGTEHPIHTIAPPHPYMLALGVLSIQKVRVQWEGGKEEGERGQERDRERGDRVERRGGGAREAIKLTGFFAIMFLLAMIHL